MVELSTDDTAVLNYIQRTIPFVERPFAKIGSDLRIPEADIIDIVKRLKDRNVIRDLAASFNGSHIGYCSNLVAMEVPESCMTTAVDLINSHPGVNHSYLRDHKYSIWFSLTEESDSLFDRSVEILAKKSGALDFLVFKNEKLLKISEILPVGEDWLLSGIETPKKRTYSKIFSENEKEAARLFQIDLPVVKRPFRALAVQSGSTISEKQLIEIGELLTNKNIMIQYSAGLCLRNFGNTCNAMTTWRITGEDDMEEKTLPFMYDSSVSNLYLRNTTSGRWEYPLFAMIRSKSQSGLKCIISNLAERSGIKDYFVLNTMSELKRKRVLYFSPEFSEWRTMYSND